MLDVPLDSFDADVLHDRFTHRRDVITYRKALASPVITGKTYTVVVWAVAVGGVGEGGRAPGGTFQGAAFQGRQIIWGLCIVI